MSPESSSTGEQWAYERDTGLNLYVVGKPDKYGHPSSYGGILVIDEELAAIKAMSILQAKDDEIAALQGQVSSTREALETIAETLRLINTEAVNAAQWGIFHKSADALTLLEIILSPTPILPAAKEEASSEHNH